MKNKDFIKIFEKTAQLMELLGENEFQIRNYQNLIFKINSISQEVAQTSEKELERLGFSKNHIQKFEQIQAQGFFEKLQQLEQKTPAGLFEVLKIKGLGAKKVRRLWQELKIESLDDLKEALEKGSVSALKGFGEKTAQNIAEQIVFLNQQAGKVRLDTAQLLSLHLQKSLQSLQEKNPHLQIYQQVGEFRRKMPTISEIAFVVGIADFETQRTTIFENLHQIESLVFDKAQSNPYTWRGYFEETHLKEIQVVFYLTTSASFYAKVVEKTGSQAHLQKVGTSGKTLLSLCQESYRHQLSNPNKNSFKSEAEVYAACGLEMPPPPLREGLFEDFFYIQTQKKNSPLLELNHIKGILHAHSTDSDGKQSLEEMAQACAQKGFTYLGLTDHSQAAHYAGGLTPERVLAQQARIDQWNAQNPTFRIFKGIEADILANGDLDYEPKILETFDFVIASVHSGLKMSQEKATERLLKAIQNPFTTILGHPTGRLLLSREGYPLDFQAIIEACATHQVAIEINANPYRLDLDWQQVGYAIEKGVKIAICPDAHSIAGIEDTQFGVWIAQKAGLTVADTLNALNSQEFESYLKMIKRKKLALNQ
ncbi:DNA polymerase/3'-5' exonuclease PolX [Hugenholtzia roseola]|uniref:DNA polymerase/3'-5' exonuclease PolX n=1 Tax=Hugenholtzia roseola TaxID=1002 RepID=UPI0003F9F829|nr:DNA polymerase/3'-5' exonuclease PolX [Hugenholtzia roseola]